MTTSETLWIKPDWPAPSNVRSCSTTRLGGVSKGSYDSLNLGLHVNDDERAVLENRQRLKEVLGYEQIAWLNQVHSTDVVEASVKRLEAADASWTKERNIACVVMTADCLPVLFCDKSGQFVAAAHAGWRGLVNGILEATVSKIPVAREDLMAWMGPAIGPNKFEVGAEVREAFIAHNKTAEKCFKNSNHQGRYFANIYQLAKQRLISSGVTAIYGGNLCTVSDDERFFSYRRERVTGRMASLIWLAN